MERKGKRNRARILRKSVHYPTYQLFATAASSRETPERQVVIGALTVLEWLRTKFRKFEIPEEFDIPKAEDCQSVRLEDLKSARIDVGYSVETVCVPEEKAWAFRLTEPDLSTVWEEGAERSVAVPGRIFETNVAFRAAGPAMQCGVSVIISEPEGTEQPCHVLRPALVQLLAEDPRLGLTCGYPLEEKLWELSSREKVKQLRGYLERAMLPAVVFCDLGEKREERHQPPAQVKLIPLPPGAQVFAPPLAMPGPGMPRPMAVKAVPVRPVKENFRIPYDVSRFVGARMGCVQSFHLPADQFDSFQKVLRLEVEQGDVLFLEPKELGGGCQRFAWQEEEQEQQYRALMELTRDYLRNKPVDFGRVAFLTEAKLLQVEHFKKRNLSVEETMRLHEEQIELLESRHREELLQWEEKLELQTGKLNRLKDELEQSYDRARQDREEARGVEADLQMQLDMAKDQIEYFKSWRTRPQIPQEVPQWAAERLSGKLELLPRAVKQLQGLAPNTIDMQLLCDALEFLANEYRDQKNRLITRDEADARGAEKYAKTFKVVPSGEATVNQYADKYLVEYDDGGKNSPKRRALEEHLKTGNKAEFLIRIYFFYDGRNQKIIVGSLPEHLPTAGIG